MWTSPDGRGWATTILHEGSGQVLEVDAMDGLLVLSGSTWTGEYRDITGVTWASHDAITWNIHQISGDLALKPGGLLVFEQVQDPETFLLSLKSGSAASDNDCAGHPVDPAKWSLVGWWPDRHDDGPSLGPPSVPGWIAEEAQWRFSSPMSTSTSSRIA